MKIKSFFQLFLLVLVVSSCVSTKSTLMNVDENAPSLKINNENAFVITEYSKDSKYGYNPDYPINLFFKNIKDEQKNLERFFYAITGPKGEKIFFKKVGTCCPFPTKKSEMGAGYIDLYEITWVGQRSPIKLYINIFEKGVLMVPKGFELRKFSN
jgi:hypothetical protein